MFDFIVLAIFRQFISAGSLTVTIADQTPQTLKGAHSGPNAEIHIHDRRVLWRLVLEPDLAFGESYMDGRLTVPEGGLEPLMDFLMTNAEHWSKHWLGRLTLKLGQSFAFLQHLNPPSASKRNVAHHYDLTDDLFSSFLDPWRQYSCAYFHDDEDTLEQAQINKLARLAAKLDLNPGEKVPDIGCGWGGLARAMALCVQDTEITGITLSKQQLAYAKTAAAKTGLNGRLNFHLRDYRRQDGRFDKIISVGMLEHVGPQNFARYFDKVRNLLAPNGVAVIHSIGVHHRARPVNRWLTKYIFPGGYLPSVDQMIKATEGRGLKLLDLEIMRGHYAETLREWRLKFMEQKPKIEALYDSRFVRMWEFYLVGCEYFFRSQRGMVMQLQLSLDQNAVPKSRRYIGQREQKFRDKLWHQTHSGNENPSPK
ncbi:cyclopropane-fatty-acyl-phospholipid synthase family protein [SAR116 cluster bacterium]|nr:cyclopropane-fatty-acyl-phospholipid synthase family protein [SAR116 cluster bacterium]